MQPLPYQKKRRAVVFDVDDTAVLSSRATAHSPVLQGLRHGGMAEKLRKLSTEFGSGWQGLGNLGTLEVAYQLKQANETSAYSPILGREPEGILGLRQKFADLQSLHTAAHDAMPFVEGPIERLGAGDEQVAFALSPTRVLKSGPEGMAHGLRPEELAGIPEILQPEKVHYHPGVTNRIYPRAQMYPEGAYPSEGQRAAYELQDKLAKRGLRWTDISPRNIGKVNGVPQVIDAGFMTRIAREVMRTGASEAAATGTAISSSSKLLQGARRMLSHL